MKDYVLMSPIGATRLYALDVFLEGVDALRPAPREIVFAVDSDLGPKARAKLDSYANEILVVPASDSPGMLSRISAAREALREWQLTHDYELSFWLDSDIVVPPDLPETLIRLQEETRYSVIVHCYPGRSPNSVWHGSGIMLIHRMGAEAGRFIVTSAGGMHISEDYNFFSLVSGAEPILKQYFGMQGVAKVCISSKVVHYMHPDLKPYFVPESRTNSLDYWIRLLKR